MDAYQKLANQYALAQKPVIYEYKNPAITVRQRKFGVILGKIKKILESGIKPQYLQTKQEQYYYWNVLVTFFKQYKHLPFNYNDLTQQKLKEKLLESQWWQIDYVQDQMHLLMEEKVKLWIVLLLIEHKLFEALDEIGKNLPDLFVDPNYMSGDAYKINRRSIQFLMDYQFTVTCDLAGSYEKYCEERRQNEFLQGLEVIKRIRNEKEKEKEEQLANLQMIKDVHKALYDVVMREVKIIQDAEQQLRIKEEKEKERQKIIKQKSNQKSNVNSDLPAYIERPITSIYESTYNLNSTPTPEFHANEIHLKKSQKLYRQQFEKMRQQFHFNVQPQQSQDKTQCFECKTKLHVGLYLIGNNQNLCNYTGKYFCNDCIASERTPVPWKALRNFDLRGYTVSKTALNEIRAYYDKPIIQIPLNAMVIQKSRILFQFLVVKRQIHLMYDSVCNIELIEGVLKSKLNYCLKLNLFSLHNLYNIYNGQELPALEQIYLILSKHFNRCKDCLKKGYICKICNKPDRIFPFELRQTKGCAKCKRLYHMHCMRFKPCICSNK